MRRLSVSRLGPCLLALLAGALTFGPSAPAQVLNADCFENTCGGQKGIPRCPDGYSEVGFVLYANSKADANQDCETVVSCTNFGEKPIAMSCRFYHGFNPIRPGGPTDALCSAETPRMDPGDTTECATDATAAPAFQAGGIFLAGDGDCPTFEGKGLVCVSGGNPKKVECQAHLVCGGGSVVESVKVVSRNLSNGNGPKDKD